MKQAYVCGIALSEDYRHVVMIRKDRPASLAGKLNFPGGKIEADHPRYELPDEAMRREFQEETGILIEDWELISYFDGGTDFVIYFYKAVTDRIFDCQSMESEVVSTWPVNHILDEFTLQRTWDIRLNQPCSVMLSLALQKQVQYPVRFHWNGVRDNSQAGL